MKHFPMNSSLAGPSLTNDQNIMDKHELSVPLDELPPFCSLDCSSPNLSQNQQILWRQLHDFIYLDGSQQIEAGKSIVEWMESGSSDNLANTLVSLSVFRHLSTVLKPEMDHSILQSLTTIVSLICSSGIRNTRVFFETGFCESVLTFLLTPALPDDVSDQSWDILAAISNVIPLASVETSFPSLSEVLQIHTNNFDRTTLHGPIKLFLISEFKHVIFDKTSPNAPALQTCLNRITLAHRSISPSERQHLVNTLRQIDLDMGQDLHPLERLPRLRWACNFELHLHYEAIFSSLSRLFILQPTLPIILAQRGELMDVCRSPWPGSDRLDAVARRHLFELASSNEIVAKHLIDKEYAVYDDLTDRNNKQFLNLYKSKYPSLVKHNNHVVSELYDCLNKPFEDYLGDRTTTTEEGAIRILEKGTFSNILEWIYLAIPESDDLDTNAPSHSFGCLAPDLILFMISNNTILSQAARTAFERVTGMTPSEADVFLTQTSLDIHTAENGMSLSTHSLIPTETSLLKQASTALSILHGSRKGENEIFHQNRSSPNFLRDFVKLYTCTTALAIFLNPSASSPPPAKLSHLVRCVVEPDILLRSLQDYNLTLTEAEHLLEVIPQLTLKLFTFVDAPTKIVLPSMFLSMKSHFFWIMRPKFSFESLLRIGNVLLSEGPSTHPQISQNLLEFFREVGDETVEMACRSLSTNHLSSDAPNTSNQTAEMTIDDSVRSEEVTETDLMCHLVRLMNDTSSSSQLESLLPLGTYLLWDAEKIHSFTTSPDSFLPELLSQVSRLDSPVLASNALNALTHSLDTFPTQFQSTCTQQIVSAVVDTLSTLPKLSTQVFCFAVTLNSFGKSERVAKAAMNCATSLIHEGALDPHVIAPLLVPFISADNPSLVSKAIDTFSFLKLKTHFTQTKIEMNSYLSRLVEILADVWLESVVNFAKSDLNLDEFSSEWRKQITPDQFDLLIVTRHQRLLSILSSLLKPVERKECDEVGILSSLHSLSASTMIRFVELSLRTTVSTIREMCHLAQRLSVSRDIVWRCHTLLVRLGMTDLTDAYRTVIHTLQHLVKSDATETSLEQLVAFYAERIIDGIDKNPKESWMLISDLSDWSQNHNTFVNGGVVWRRMVEKVKEEGIGDQLPLTFTIRSEGLITWLGWNCLSKNRFQQHGNGFGF
ncbi:hypothetical protein BLNAU_18936 [Blattamonas nauphoetae]|uniref:Uncharacterized protein n=1 Tax=Blattamonas nauphoetae TaxID=2049346 RepID=A0ABQ9X2Z6_9EUKA|nr:hypothetical protein BLNAU_18936 [Blattamonas nauphoetae]